MSCRSAGGLVDAGSEYHRNLADEVAKLQRLYGGGDLTSFPEFKFTGDKEPQRSWNWWFPLNSVWNSPTTKTLKVSGSGGIQGNCLINGGVKKLQNYEQNCWRKRLYPSHKPTKTTKINFFFFFFQSRRLTTFPTSELFFCRLLSCVSSFNSYVGL